LILSIPVRVTQKQKYGPTEGRVKKYLHQNFILCCKNESNLIHLRNNPKASTRYSFWQNGNGLGAVPFFVAEMYSKRLPLTNPVEIYMMNVSYVLEGESICPQSAEEISMTIGMKLNR